MRDDFAYVLMTPFRRAVMAFAAMALAGLSLGAASFHNPYEVPWLFNPLYLLGTGHSLTNLIGFFTLLFCFLFLRGVISPFFALYGIYLGALIYGFPAIVHDRWWLTLLVFASVSAYHWFAYPLFLRQRECRLAIADAEGPPTETFSAEDYCEAYLDPEIRRKQAVRGQAGSS